jgi:hypothetical protein
MDSVVGPRNRNSLLDVSRMTHAEDAEKENMRECDEITGAIVDPSVEIRFTVGRRFNNVPSYLRVSAPPREDGDGNRVAGSIAPVSRRCDKATRIGLMTSGADSASRMLRVRSP